MACDAHCIFLCIYVGILLSCFSAHGSEPVDLEQYLQSNFVSDKDYFKNSSCYRPCEEDQPRICYYKLLLDDYKTMGPACRNCPKNISDCFRHQCITADGYERGMLSVNHQLPGPSIQVCVGDRVVVDVINKFQGQSTTIHWHGLHQKEAPYMDGVPMITQCPISEMTTFRYDFIASNSGTLYWHSHDGFQKLDGIQGSMVVRRSKLEDPNSHMYDFDLASHVILISDWMHSPAGEHFPGLETHDMFQEPVSTLLNGRGRYIKDNYSTETPYSTFRVRKDKRYRFRLVGGMCTSCPYQFSIEKHPLLLIAVDGCPVEPVWIDSIVIYAGERYDFVLEATETPKSYWIHVKAAGNCKAAHIHTLGILRYSGTKPKKMEDPGYDGYSDGRVMNMFNGTCNVHDSAVCVTQLISLNPVPLRIKTLRPDFTFILHFGFHSFSVDEVSQPGEFERYFQPVQNRLLSSVMNNISYEMSSSPLLSQREDINEEIFCPVGYTGMPRCPYGEEGYCQCLHLLQIPLGAIAQFILVDEGTGGINHPFHMHGYSFNVIAMGQFGPGEDEHDLIRELHRGSLRIPTSTTYKDTLAVPSKGYAVIRIQADNPGYWFFHCHVLYHGDTGMAVVLQVGEHSEIQQPPKEFPKCGDYLPPVYSDVHNKRSKG